MRQMQSDNEFDFKIRYITIERDLSRVMVSTIFLILIVVTLIFLILDSTKIFIGAFTLIIYFIPFVISTPYFINSLKISKNKVIYQEKRCGLLKNPTVEILSKDIVKCFYIYDREYYRVFDNANQITYSKSISVKFMPIKAEERLEKFFIENNIKIQKCKSSDITIGDNEAGVSTIFVNPRQKT